MARFTLLSLARSLVAPLALAALLLCAGGAVQQASAGVPTSEVDRCQTLLSQLYQGIPPPGGLTQANIDLVTRCLQLLYGNNPQQIADTLAGWRLIAG